MNERSYWNSNGEAQALYDEMQAAAFKYTKATGALFHSYHRYYNDGDLPGWARSRPDMTRYDAVYEPQQTAVEPDVGEEEEIPQG